MTKEGWFAEQDVISEDPGRTCTRPAPPVTGLTWDCTRLSSQGEAILFTNIRSAHALRINRLPPFTGRPCGDTLRQNWVSKLFCSAVEVFHFLFVSACEARVQWCGNNRYFVWDNGEDSNNYKVFRSRSAARPESREHCPPNIPTSHINSSPPGQN